VASFVLVLVLFILMGREELGDRIVHLFGHKQISLTTRTKAEIAQRITRYLATFAFVNSAFGLVIGLGLWLIGVPFAVLWGCLAGMMRFIPYIGPRWLLCYHSYSLLHISPGGHSHWSSWHCSR